MGNTCYTGPKTELDQHIDKYHKNRRAPAQQPPYMSDTQFTSNEDFLEPSKEIPAEFQKAYDSSNYVSNS